MRNNEPIYDKGVVTHLIIENIKKLLSPDKLDKDEWYDFKLQFKIVDDLESISGGATLEKSIDASSDLKLCQDYYKQNYQKGSISRVISGDIGGEFKEPKVTEYYQQEQKS